MTVIFSNKSGIWRRSKHDIYLCTNHSGKINSTHVRINNQKSKNIEKKSQTCMAVFLRDKLQK